MVFDFNGYIEWEITLPKLGRPINPEILWLRSCSSSIGEIVRRARTILKGTGFLINEQFPKEIADRHRQLLPKMRQATRDGKSAWISYDTLYIEGRPIRDEPH